MDARVFLFPSEAAARRLPAVHSPALHANIVSPCFHRALRHTRANNKVLIDTAQASGVFWQLFRTAAMLLPYQKLSHRRKDSAFPRHTANPGSHDS